MSIRFDEKCRRIVGKHPDAAVAWLLMAAYAYYVEDDPILSDGLFDELCRGLVARWDEVRHPHARLLSSEDIATGSIFALSEDQYPAMVIGSLYRLRKDPMANEEEQLEPKKAPVVKQGQLLLI